jgi:hypothetical protein
MPFDIGGNIVNSIRLNLHNNTRPVRDSSLVLYLDAGDSSSYPGTGSTWYDLSGNGYNGTLVNSPTWSATNGGIFTFNGSNQYIDVSSPNMSSSNFTVMGAARYVTVGGRIISGLNNNWLLGHWSSSVLNYYSAGWVSSVGAGGGDTLWRVYAGTGNIGASSYQLFSNGSAVFSAAAGGTAGPNGFSLGRYAPGNSEYSNGQIGFLIVYNRVLTNQEILQNYLYFRQRYELYYDCGYGCQLYSYDPGCTRCPN